MNEKRFVLVADVPQNLSVEAVFENRFLVHCLGYFGPKATRHEKENAKNIQGFPCPMFNIKLQFFDTKS